MHVETNPTHLRKIFWLRPLMQEIKGIITGNHEFEKGDDGIRDFRWNDLMANISIENSCEIYEVLIDTLIKEVKSVVTEKAEFENQSK